MFLMNTASSSSYKKYFFVSLIVDEHSPISFASTTFSWPNFLDESHSATFALLLRNKYFAYPGELSMQNIRHVGCQDLRVVGCASRETRVHCSLSSVDPFQALSWPNLLHAKYAKPAYARCSLPLRPNQPIGDQLKCIWKQRWTSNNHFSPRS